MKRSRTFTSLGCGLALAFVAATNPAFSAGRERQAARADSPGRAAAVHRNAAPAAVPASFATASASIGAVAIVDVSGQKAPGNVFSSRDQVYFTGGLFDPPCTIGALADGTYDYQVTDASGKTLLSGNPRSFVVSGGVIVSAEGTTAPAPNGCGSTIVALAPFDRAPGGAGNYRLWVTSEADLQTGTTCGLGCYFGFVPSSSTTQAFAVREDSRCRTTHCLSGVVFSDLDQNGVQSADEPGLSGVVISATDTRGIVANAITGPDGSWSICGLPETTYTVTETLPAGFRQTAPSVNRQISRYLSSVAGGGSGSYTVTFCNDSFSNLTFGNFALLGSLSGTKFNDANGNGVLDTGEAGVAGVSINLYAGDPTTTAPIATSVTDANGAFAFSDVPAATYALTETLPSGYRQTVPGGDGTLPVTLSPGQTIANLLFGNQLAAATITGTKFDDANGNGIRDAGEEGLSGVTIIAAPVEGASLVTTTDASGNFSFTGLTAGTYVLSEVVPDGFHQTFPGAPGTVSVNLSAGQTATVLFGNQANAAAGTITGLKFNDANGNGAPDSGEPGVGGVTINLLAAAGGSIVATTTTASDGTFTFSGVNPGSYQVSEVVPEGSVQTLPGGDGMIPVTVSAGETTSGVTFGNRSTTAGSVSGFIFYDLNKNQKQDDGETPFAGVTVHLKNGSGDVVGTAVTDAAGHFTFVGVAPGDYTVTPVPPLNFFQTFPPQNAAIPVHVESGENVTGLVFGLSC